MSKALTRREAIKSIGIGSTVFAGAMLSAIAEAVDKKPQTSPASKPGNGVTVKKIFEHPLTDFPGHSAVILRVDYAPGAASPPHHHPGSVFGYVLEGAIISALDPWPGVTYTKGQMWYEEPKQVHRVSRNASTKEPASLLAFLVVPKGEAITTPDK